MTDRRRLQAIMFTDIEGFSAMMSADEATTVRVVREHREIVRQELVRHGGNEIRTIGDAFMVLFDSAIDACTCAIAVQERLLARNQNLPRPEQVWIRVGLHVGEVLIGADGELYGEAVNIAARCEPLAPRGGICLTEAVVAQVRGRIAHTPERIGVVPLKNIPDPPCLYRLAIAPTEALKARGAPWRFAAAGLGAVGVVLVAFGAWWTWSDDGGAVSDVPEAQELWEQAWRSLVDADLARIQLIADEAHASDPTAPEIALLHAVTRPDDAETLTELRDLAEHATDPAYRDLAAILVRNRNSPDDKEVAKALDAWLAAHPDDAFGCAVASLEYPMHGATGQVHVAGAHDHARTTVLGAYATAHPEMLLVGFQWIAGLRSDGHRAEARAAAQGLLERYPRNPAVHAFVGAQALEDEDFDAAERALRSALELDPTLPGTREGLIDLAFRRGDAEEYQRRLDAFFADDGFGTLQALFALGLAQKLVLDGRIHAGSALVARTIERVPDDPRIQLDGLLQLGRTCATQQATNCRTDVLEKIRTLMIAPELSPEYRDQLTIDLLGYESQLAFDQGDAVRTQEVADRLARLPADRFVQVSRDAVLGDATVRADALNGRIDQALASMHDKLVGCFQPFQEGNVLRAAGRTAEAEARYQAALEVPDCAATEVTVGARVWLARWAADRGDTDAARALIAAAREKYPRAEPDAPFVVALNEIEARLPH